MKTPKYKLGDIIEGHDGRIKLITSITKTAEGVRYFTKHLNGIWDGRRCLVTTEEGVIDMFYTVIGNILDKSQRKSKISQRSS